MRRLRRNWIGGRAVPGNERVREQLLIVQQPREAETPKPVPTRWSMLDELAWFNPLIKPRIRDEDTCQNKFGTQRPARESTKRSRGTEHAMILASPARWVWGTYAPTTARTDRRFSSCCVLVISAIPSQPLPRKPSHIGHPGPPSGRCPNNGTRGTATLDHPQKFSRYRASFASAAQNPSFVQSKHV